LWKRDLGPYTSQHGAGHSPVVYDGRVFFPYDMDGAATLLALDGKTGKNLWQVPRTPYRACYSSPFMLDRNGKPELIVASTAGVSGYNPQTGGENWSFTWTFAGMPLRTVASPIAGLGMIFATSGDGGGARHAIGLKASGKGDVSKTNLVWENKRTLPYVPAMLVWGDHLYFVNDRGLAGCFVARTGEEVWTERLGDSFSASPILINGNIYAPNELGQVYVFPASTTFKLLAKNNLGEGVRASPAVADNKLYIRGKQHLFCIGKP
jgi:outer membrane protein assembly factor BamB